MFQKTNKEIKKFSQGLETIKSHETLLDYIKSDFFASIKLLISVSSTFSIYWKAILPFIVSFSILLLLSTIKPISEQLNAILNTNYILGIFVFLILFSFVYILSCKKYFISCIKNSMSLMEKDKEFKS